MTQHGDDLGPCKFLSVDGSCSDQLSPAVTSRFLLCQSFNNARNVTEYSMSVFRSPEKSSAAYLKFSNSVCDLEMSKISHTVPVKNTCRSSCSTFSRGRGRTNILAVKII